MASVSSMSLSMSLSSLSSSSALSRSLSTAPSPPATPDKARFAEIRRDSPRFAARASTAARSQSRLLGLAASSCHWMAVTPRAAGRLPYPPETSNPGAAPVVRG